VTRERRRALGALATHLLVLAVLLLFLFPFYWMAISGLKSPDELFTFPPTLVPRSWSLDFYARVLAATGFVRLAVNSLIVALATTALAILLGAMGAYSITRFRYPGRRFIARMVLFIYMFPPILLIIPLFYIFRTLLLLDTYVGLILANTTFALPFCLWLLMAFFRTIPEEIESAALVDGAGRIEVLWRIVVPLAAPGLAAAAVFAFISAWNEYLFALVLINSDEMKTLPLGVARYVSGEGSRWGEAMAAATLLSLPVFVFASIVQKHLVSGLTAGAVKG
jgi:multiple sugar transport system permease protein